MKSIYRKLPLKYQMKILRTYNNIKSFKVKQNTALRSNNSKKRIYYLLTPEHGNIGDAAIVCGTYHFLNTRFSEYEVIEYSNDEYTVNKQTIKKEIRAGDLIMIHGGGNLGDWYPELELNRHEIINTYFGIPIISMPQTISFNNRKNTDWLLNDAKKTYSNKPNLLLVCRDDISLNFANSNFLNTKLFKCPDMALCYDDYFVNRKALNNKVLFCLRNDVEKNDSNNFIEEMKSFFDKKGLTIGITDTHITNDIKIGHRDEVVIGKLNEFKKYDLIITDRYHGIIFSYLTDTPCIALGSKDHKVKENSKYFSETKMVEFIEKYDEFEDAYDCICGKNYNRISFNEKHFDYFEKEILNLIDRNVK